MTRRGTFHPLVILLLLVAATACGNSTSFNAWQETLLDVADMGIPDHYARVILSSTEEQRRNHAINSCLVLFTLDPNLQEVRAVGWRDARSLASNPDDVDIITAANYATMKSPDVCFKDDEVKASAFSDGPFTEEPLPVP